MLIDTFDMFSFYAQLEVNGLDLDDYAAPHWTQRHVEQGFIQLPKSVGFGLLSDVGRHVVEVHIEAVIRQQPGAVRSIVVPYTVAPNGQVELSDCVYSPRTSLPAGEYALLFETGNAEKTASDDPDETEYWVRLTFVPERHTQPAILVADDDLQPTYPLLLGI